ncbi:MAG: sulfatase-like hydrolase/transferase, partial [bacterium]|nr:sulfatase-like hydrolase/transferase [bacterium]
ARFNCHCNGCKGSVLEGGIRVPMLLRWPDRLPAGATTNRMVHFADWLPTLLTALGAAVPGHLRLDGIDVWPVLRGEPGRVETRRFWQWNRYTPVATCNAAMRDGDWKLVRPVQHEAMAVPDIQWLKVTMYNYDYFLENGVIRTREPWRQVPAPPPAELYNLAVDPLERVNLAGQHPDKVRAM